jgi:hypothetical protein
MSRYPPRTSQQLRELYLRNRCPEARELLWEIARLHGLVFNLAEFLARLERANLGYGEQTTLANLIVATNAEPSVQRERAIRRSERGKYLHAPAVMGCSMIDLFVGPPERWQVEARRFGESKRKRRR